MRRFRIALFAIALAVVLQTVAFSQSAGAGGSISGKITPANIPANVSILRYGDIIATADTDVKTGEYTLKGLAAGSYALKFMAEIDGRKLFVHGFKNDVGAEKLSAEDEKEIITLIQSLRKATLSKDFKKAMSFYSKKYDDSFGMSHKSVRAWVDGATRFKDGLESFDYDGIIVDITGREDYAIASTHYTYAYKFQNAGKLTKIDDRVYLFRKKKGKYKIIGERRVDMAGLALVAENFESRVIVNNTLTNIEIKEGDEAKDRDIDFQKCLSGIKLKD